MLPRFPKAGGRRHCVQSVADHRRRQAGQHPRRCATTETGLRGPSNAWTTLQINMTARMGKMAPLSLRGKRHVAMQGKRTVSIS
jgi:hypothetical protein